MGFREKHKEIYIFPSSSIVCRPAIGLFTIQWALLNVAPLPSLCPSFRPSRAAVPPIFLYRKATELQIQWKHSARQETIGEILRSNGKRSRSLGTKMWKSFFANIFVKGGPIYINPRSKWSSVHSTYRWIQVTRENAYIFDIWLFLKSSSVSLCTLDTVLFIFVELPFKYRQKHTLHAAVSAQQEAPAANAPNCWFAA